MNAKTMFAALACLLVAGCVSTPLPKVDVRQVRDIPMGEDVRELELKKIVIKVRRGQVIGNLQRGGFCISQGELLWNSDRITMSDNEFTDAFYQEMKSRNFPVTGNPDALFGDDATSRAELVIAGMIDDIKGNLCWSSNYGFLGGDAYVQVLWQVYDVHQRKVIYEVTTKGTADNNSSGVSGMNDIMVNAFVVATNNLMADEGFRRLVLKQEGADEAKASSPAVAEEAMTFSGAGKGGKAIDTPAGANAAVATIMVKDGHGSGFFIGPEGYLLTNYHVVQEADEVTVRLPSGVELAGKVLRRNKVRDVALVKVEGKAFPALVVQEKQPDVGADVFALGTPLDERMSNTLTKGIVSAYRDEDGLPILQSDVATNQGNSGGPLVDARGQVVAVCVAGIMPAERTQIGLNFFIPIASALEKLNIKVE